jgi:VanZ family protein
MRRQLIISFIFLLLFAKQTAAHFPLTNDSVSLFQNSPVPDKHRKHALNIGIGGLYTISMAWLYTQWYSGYPQSAFHYFNDNGEWEQVDKFAHCWNTYTFSKAMTHAYRWTGMEEKKAIIWGTTIGLGYQTMIEIFDGFNSEWGFSGGDMIANITGAAIFTGQQFGWREQRIVLKYSRHQTEYPQYRPDLLGKNFSENMLKDYNGLTQWVTINPRSFFKDSKIPRWFSIGLGYGAEGMTGGEENPLTVDGKPIPEFERYRQYYLSIDFDLSRIQTRSRLLSGIFRTINFIHLPAPAIEWASGRKPVWHLMYF